MAEKEQKKKKGLVAALVVGGLAGAAALAWLFGRKAEAEEPEPPPDGNGWPPAPPEGYACLWGVVTDSLTGETIPNARVVLGDVEIYTDVNGLYVFYVVDPGTYSMLVEYTFYNTKEFNITLPEGINTKDIALDPTLLAGVVIGARTKATDPDLTEPSSSYKSRLTFNGGLLGDDYISNGSSYKNNTINLAVNPETKEKWREAELYTNRFGVWLWASAWTPAEYPATRCTQFWVKAVFEDGSSIILRPYEGDGFDKVNEEAADEDQSYISWTTSGGMIPWAGRDFQFLVK